MHPRDYTPDVIADIRARHQAACMLVNQIRATLADESEQLESDMLEHSTMPAAARRRMALLESLESAQKERRDLDKSWRIAQSYDWRVERPSHLSLLTVVSSLAMIGVVCLANNEVPQHDFTSVRNVMFPVAHAEANLTSASLAPVQEPKFDYSPGWDVRNQARLEQQGYTSDIGRQVSENRRRNGKQLSAWLLVLSALGLAGLTRGALVTRKVKVTQKKAAVARQQAAEPVDNVEPLFTRTRRRPLQGRVARVA